MSTSGGYHEYIGGCSVHWGDQIWVIQFILKADKGLGNKFSCHFVV